MRFVLFAAAFTLAACGGSPPADQAAKAVAPAAPEKPTPAPLSAGIPGWEIDMTAYSGIGARIPAFTAKRADGKDLTAESLRGRWTILGLWPEGAPPASEATFAAALNSATDQDPDLDLLIAHRTAPAPNEAPPWPHVVDDGKIAAAINAPAAPAYFLIGPDLTIEGYRGALSATPEDGVKPVLKGVAEIRKQVAAPE